VKSIKAFCFPTAKANYIWNLFLSGSGSTGFKGGQRGIGSAFDRRQAYADEPEDLGFIALARAGRLASKTGNDE
jgi:hypothetical protein